MRTFGTARLVILGVIAAVFVWSAIVPYDRATWWMEVAPVIIAVPMMLATHRRFPLTMLTWVLIGIHAVILMVGGHYSYARVPLFDTIRDMFGLARNHYDRLGHFAQGFVPAIVAREVLLRTSPLRRGGWLFTLVTAVCLAISALYELIEWASAEIAGEGAADFLGSQGDIWDAQKDMLLALIGAIVAQLVLSRLHDRQLEKIE